MRERCDRVLSQFLRNTIDSFPDFIYGFQTTYRYLIFALNYVCINWLARKRDLFSLFA